MWAVADLLSLEILSVNADETTLGTREGEVQVLTGARKRLVAQLV